MSMTKKQANAAAKRWDFRWTVEKEERRGPPSNLYDITIVVEADGAELKVRLPGIKRTAIMSPGYDRGIQIAVQNFEDFVYGRPLPARGKPPAKDGGKS